MFKLYGFRLGGRNFAGGAISSPFERFSWWRVPSLETTKTGLTGKMLVGRGGGVGGGADAVGAAGGGGAARPVNLPGGGGNRGGGGELAGRPEWVFVEGVGVEKNEEMF